jgi:hypothetical protein
VGAWFAGDSSVSTQIEIKLALLAVTIVLPLDAQLRIIPGLTKNQLDLWYRSLR